ncbi:transmembrane protein [Achlya hypogyna]|uniref:Transmembrane protein n=1 Tax=Achlya hypogyna TaxID=1202772 RepID=A0A1V9YIJ5_ACHHY|nr:transmembrane protein [Achlya hypogyna]
MTTLLRALVVGVVAISTTASSCNGIDAMPKNILGGPLALQVRVDNASACFRLTYTGTGADWISLGLSTSQYMVNNPPNNAVVFDAKRNLAKVHVLKGYNDDNVVASSAPSSITILSSSVVDDVLAVTYEHAFNAVSANDVAIDLENGNNVLLWAYGKGFPSYHDDQGAQSISIRVPTDDGSAPDNLDLSATKSSPAAPTYRLVLGAILFFAVLGVVTTRLSATSATLGTPLVAPPAHLTSITDSFQVAIADLNLGQAFVVALYMMLVGLTLGLLVPHFSGLPPVRAASVVCGHLSVLHLAFLLLPASRGGHWGYLFGVPHTRLVTFHKWLGVLFLATLLLHFALNLATIQWNVLRSSMPFGADKVIPAYGLYAGIIFGIMGLSAAPPVRKWCYELFYVIHRGGFFVGIVLVCLHAKAIWLALAAPLGLYVATLVVLRTRAFWQRFQGHVMTTTSSTVLFELQASKQTKRWLDNLAPCAYFYVCIPSISRTEWHPFSAIVSPHTGHLAFCVKSRGPGTFTDQLVQLAHNDPVFDVLVGGPYGRPSLRFRDYEHVLLFAGGIGITPMLHIIQNGLALESGQGHLIWVVREKEALLSVAPAMFPLGVPGDFFVSGASDNGHVKTVTGEIVGFQAGRPDIREEIKRFGDCPNTTHINRPNVCVIACGPASFVHEVQVAAHHNGFHFHKELFC